ncbi:MAG: hemerythrin domain-containing protein [Acidobacteriota bacterium]
MHRAIAELMEEHRIIEKVLGSLETFALALGSPSPKEREAVRGFGEFFRLFADRCHHGKEEDRLFAKMAEGGFPTEVGPIAVMLSEHVEGRACVAAFVRAGDGSGPLAEEERSDVAEAVGRYVSLLRAHILKEDNILYPMALQALPLHELNSLAESYRTFEREAVAEGEHQRLLALADRLGSLYPPDPARASEASSCFGCPGRA